MTDFNTLAPSVAAAAADVDHAE